MWKGQPIAPASEIAGSILTVSINPYYLGLCGRFWFMPTMFLSSVFAYVLRNYIIGKHGIWLNCICIAVLFGLSYGTTHLSRRLPFTIDITFLATAWLMIGYSAGKFLTWLISKKHIAQDLLAAAVCFALFAACNLIATPKCWMYTNHYVDYPFMIVAALTGVFMVFLVSKWLLVLFSRVKPIHHFILWYGFNSLAIYPIHMGIMAIFTEVLRDRTWYFMLVAMLFGTIPAVNIVRNYMPFMLGNFKKRTG